MTCPIIPIERARIKNPLQIPDSMYIFFSSYDIPIFSKISSIIAALIPSTLSIRFAFFSRVISSTDFAKSRYLVLGNFSEISHKILHLISGLCFDFTLCQIQGMFSHFVFMFATKSSGEVLCSKHSKKCIAAPSMAPQNLGPMVAIPLMSADFMSFPAREVTMAL